MAKIYFSPNNSIIGALLLKKFEDMAPVQVFVIKNMTYFQINKKNTQACPVVRPLLNYEFLG